MSMPILEKSKEEKNSLTYTIQNIVVKSTLGVKSDIDLIKIVKHVKNTEYNKERFPGVFFRITDPKCVVIIFRTGKMILTGIKAFIHIKKIVDLIVTELNKTVKANIKRDMVNSEVVNIVATANFDYKINLDLSAITLNNVIFEPEVFPGLIYKCVNPVKSVFLIFNSGSVVLTGIREEKAIEPALINLGRLIRREKLFLKN
jgi:transcription initiation factor TFIID TATA-box-binding protein